jgi:hypothetical protein
MAAGNIEHVVLSGVPVAKTWHEGEFKRWRCWTAMMLMPAGLVLPTYWLCMLKQYLDQHFDLSWTLRRPYLLGADSKPNLVFFGGASQQLSCALYARLRYG